MMTSSNATAMIAARVKKPRSNRGGADGDCGVASVASSVVLTV